MPDSATFRTAARAAWREGDIAAAVESGWRALTEDPGQEAKLLFAALMNHFPQAARKEFVPAIRALIEDEHIEPESVARAGWHLAIAEIDDGADPPALAARMDADPLVHDLLRNAPVNLPAAELVLTRLRRWLLLSGNWSSFTALDHSLIAQAAINGGSWYFDTEEANRLRQAPEPSCIAAFLPLPAREHASTVSRDGEMTLAERYASWPYPRWRRITWPARPSQEGGDVLVAGCGTGRELAMVAAGRPTARVIGIDVSGESIAYAKERCAALGLSNVSLVECDLHACESLGRQFGAIYCTGVLHHLPEPEAGLRALARALAPGGRMRVGLYSTTARLTVLAARRSLDVPLTEPLGPATVRAARHQLLQRADFFPAKGVVGSPDFATMEGAIDLLFHDREQPFDPARIGRALDSAGLALLSFLLPTPRDEQRYASLFPGDVRRTDLRNITAFEMQAPRTFAGMYQFWCGRA